MQFCFDFENVKLVCGLLHPDHGRLVTAINVRCWWSQMHDKVNKILDVRRRGRGLQSLVDCLGDGP